MSRIIRHVITFCAGRKRLVIAFAVLLALWGGYAFKKIPVDAIPDLSETQVIIYSEWMGRSPQLVEDQITYPIVTSLLAAPNVATVRGFTMFGMSFVYVIFKDGTDLYWARSRVIEYLSKIRDRLPQGVNPSLGPDATGVGWIYQYVLRDTKGKYDLAQMRTFQDWYLRYWLSSVPGVAEVAGIGGYEKQYQLEINPIKLAAYNISLDQIYNAVKRSNQDVGGRTLEISEREYYVLGLGYVGKKEDLENIAVALKADGTPVRVSEVARVAIGPNIRRGISDFNGLGDSVGGVVVMRHGEDAAEVIARLKAKVREMQPSFPDGIELLPVYDRSVLIKEALATLQKELGQEIAIVCVVIFVFLLHLRSVLVVVITLPLAVLTSIIPMYYLNIPLNIMSLGGLIIAVGDIVDGVVVFIENAHKKIAESPGADRASLAIAACTELGPSIFSSLLIIAVSFLPIFALQAHEGKLFHPLAFTKTFAMLSGALITIVVAPTLIALLSSGRIRSEKDNPVNRALQNVYRPVLEYALQHGRKILVGTAGLFALMIILFTRLGSEFMPSLWEGTLLYMPITVPGISVTAATDILTRQDAAIKQIPEVESVFGKAGRYDTPTDPAPLSMLESTIQLKPVSKWRPGMTEEKLLEELDKAVTVPGLNRAWTKPVRGRVDMLSTGIRTQVGLKIYGKDLSEIERIGKEIERLLVAVRGTRSVYAERIMGGYYVDFHPDREQLGRYGLNIGDVQMVIETAIGGMTISQTVEGRERYSINMRYPRELRDSIEKLERVLVSTAKGAQVPLSLLGKLESRLGPPMIVDEDGALTGFVYIDLKDRDTGGYVSDAKAIVDRELKLPPGYYLKWTGQYEYLRRMAERMTLVLPLTLILIFILLYMSLNTVRESLLVMLSVPLALSGGIILMWALNYNMSVAVWAGIIALIGVAVETTSIMIVFIHASLNAVKKNRKQEVSRDERMQAIAAGAQKSLRPVLMAVGMNILGLLPVMAASGIGADVMKRISSPMFGGLITLTLLTLIVVPVCYSYINSAAGKK